MYALDAIKILFRRWYVIVIGLVLAGGMAWAAVVIVPTQYQASANTIFLLSPNVTGVETPTNPYLILDSALTTTAELVASIVTSAEVKDEMAVDGFTSDFSVAVSPERAAPLLFVTAVDINPLTVVNTVYEVIRRIELELARIQEDVGSPADQAIESVTFSASDEAEVLEGSGLRTLLAIGVIGVIATVLAAFGVDRLDAYRRHRIQEDPFPDAHAPSTQFEDRPELERTVRNHMGMVESGGGTIKWRPPVSAVATKGTANGVDVEPYEDRAKDPPDVDAGDSLSRPTMDDVTDAGHSARSLGLR